MIIDEVGELIRQCRQSIDLESRFKSRQNPDGSGSVLVPLRDCPMSSNSGNCTRCNLEPSGGELAFNPFGIRTLNSPRQIPIDSSGQRLRKASTPLYVREEDLKLGAEHRVSDTTFAASVAGWREKVVS